MVLPRTDRRTAEEVARRVLAAVEEDNRRHPNLPLRLSVGTATAEDPSRPLRDLCAEADDIMYRDKLARGGQSQGAVVRVLMAALAEKDFVAQGHIERVKRLACMLGEALGLSQAEMESLQVLAEIHDIGKLCIPEHILFKSGPLSAEEWEEVKRHPEVGYRICLSSSELAPLAELVRQHHEWWDGRGYPRGLRGDQIHLLSRIIAIADAYDTMTSGRPYREAWSPEEALAEIRRCAGTQFDPELVEVFVRLLGQGRGNG